MALWPLSRQPGGALGAAQTRRRRGGEGSSRGSEGCQRGHEEASPSGNETPEERGGKFELMTQDIKTILKVGCVLFILRSNVKLLNSRSSAGNYFSRCGSSVHHGFKQPC